MRSRCEVIAAFVGALALSGPALAKPVSYVDGTAIMQENDEGGSSAGIHYTVTPWMAVAFHAQRHTRASEFTMLGPQLNFLVKRWNLPDGQGNLYTSVGGGTVIENGDMRYAAWTGFLADYETRRFYSSYELRLMYADRTAKSAWQRARIGVAPYLGSYDEINLWLMLQVDRRDEKHAVGHAHGPLPPPMAVTPLIRLVYKTFLVEGGVSTRGKVMFNWVQQF